jgi:hypothetical protein
MDEHDGQDEISVGERFSRFSHPVRRMGFILYIVFNRVHPC